MNYDPNEIRVPKRGRGRPAGSPNKAKTVLTVPAAKPDITVTVEPKSLPDVSDMIGSQLRIIEAAQCQVALEIAAGNCSVKRVAELSTALAKAMDAVAKATKAQDSILSRLSEAQHVEAAIRRLESQDPGVVRLAIRRLRKAADGITEQRELRTASDAIASLSDLDVD